MTGVQTCALPIYDFTGDIPVWMCDNAFQFAIKNRSGIEFGAHDDSHFLDGFPVMKEVQIIRGNVNVYVILLLNERQPFVSFHINHQRS